MITGDHILTAKAIASNLGILQSGDLAITGEELDKISDKDLVKNIMRYSVFARVLPEHKVRIVKAFRNEEYSTERLVQLREERFYWVYKKTKFGLVSSTTMSMAFQIGYIAAFSYGAIQMSQNLITYGTMSVFLTLVNRVQAPVLQLAQQIPKVVSVIASSGRVMELERIPAEEHIDKHELTDNIGVKVDELSFGYGADEAIFDDAMLDVKPGEFVAIIGESGIGKTTLIRLLMSFMSGTSGSITYYDKEGKEERSNASSRDFISYVPQGNTLFSGTIRENIRMG